MWPQLCPISCCKSGLWPQWSGSFGGSSDDRNHNLAHEMQFHYQPFTVHKRAALTISRGTTTQTTNLWVCIEADGLAGWGEASPFSAGGPEQTTAAIVDALEALTPQLQPLHPLERDRIAQVMAQAGSPSAARAAVDLALHDWLGKKAGLPLWKLWGWDRATIPPTSVTIGISSPEVAQQRVQDWLALGDFQILKLKLGNPAGVEADRAMLRAVKTVAGRRSLSVDANGGWDLPTAIAESHWLADQGVTSIEQPLANGREADLLELASQSPLPIFADESCWIGQDIPRLADRVHGINIKLMKSGGLTEALRMIHIAQVFNLQVMLGCYSDSALLNTAAAHLTPMAQIVDLDSHLNLVDDPFQGAQLVAGCLLPNDDPGLGVTRRVS